MPTYELIYAPIGDGGVTRLATVTQVRITVSAADMSEATQCGIKFLIFMLPSHWQLKSQSEIPETPPAPSILHGRKLGDIKPEHAALVTQVAQDTGLQVFAVLSEDTCQIRTTEPEDADLTRFRVGLGRLIALQEGEA